MQNNICQKSSSEQCNSNCLNKKQKDKCQLHKIDQLEDITIIENFEGFTNHHKFEGHADMVWGIDICKEKNLLVSASSDKTVKLWNLANNTLIKTYTYSSTVSDVVFSKQGTLLAFGGQGDYSIKLHNISEHDDLVANFVGHNEGITRLVFTNDSKYLISGSGDKQLIIWDVQQRKQAFHLQSEAQVFGVAINSSDSLIASNSFDGKIRIWRFQNHKLLCIQQAHIWGAGIDFSQDDKMLVSSEYIGKIKLWSLEELNHNCKLLLIRQFQTATRCIWTVFFSPCSRYIIQICNRDSLIKIIDQQTSSEVI